MMHNKKWSLMIQKGIAVILAALLLFSLAACDKEDSSKESNSESSGDNNVAAKGTRNNPYTLEDTITVSSYAWDGNRLFEYTLLGKNTFELSNFRVETRKLPNGGEEVNVIVFDKKCIETCYEDGFGFGCTGGVEIVDFFDPNMQSLNYMNLGANVDVGVHTVYFENTMYTYTYGMDDDDAVYSLVRFRYYDEDLKEKYVYVSLEK